MLRNYAITALRNIARNPLYAAINILGLAVAVAATIFIALFVRNEYSYDRFLPGYRDVYLMTETEDMIDHRVPTEQLDFSSPDLAPKLSTQFPQIAIVARIMTPDDPPHIRHGQVEADETGFLWMDPSFFRVMPLKSLAGDLQTALKAPDSVVLTRTAARKYFGRDMPLGEVLEVNPAMAPDAAKVSAAFSTSHPMRVTAVIEDLPSNSYLKGELFGSSLAAYSQFALFDLAPQLRSLSSYTFIRLRPGTPVQQMRQELAVFANHNSRVYPPGFTVGLHLTPIGDLHLSPPSAGPMMSPRGDRKLLAALAAIAVLIITSASFNFVALMTAQAAQRGIETGVRKAVGALRRQLIAQFLGEAVIYVALAVVVAVALTEVLLPQMNSVLKQEVAFNLLGDPALGGALLFTTIALGLLAGGYPAFVLSAHRPAAVLKGTLVQGAKGGILRRALVALQFAILIGLGITAATIWRQTLFSLNNQLRVDGSSILLIDNACAPSSRAFRERLAAMPGVAGAVCSDQDELISGGMTVYAHVEGATATPMASGSVDYGALEFYGARPLAGRFFDRAHGDGDPLLEGETTGTPSIVVNEAAMRSLGFISPSQAIGKIVTWNLRRWSANPTLGTIVSSEIIGVSPNVSLDTRRPVLRQIFYLGRNSYSSLSVRLIGSQIPESLTSIDAAWSRIIHTRIHRRFLNQSLQDMYADIKLQGTAISLGAGLAGVIAALGLFGLSGHAAERRTKEIGIRKAIGASSIDIVCLMLSEFSQPVLWANLIAWPIAWWVMSRWLSGFAQRVELPFWLFLTVSGAALSIACVTVLHHALTVARARPVAALRYE